jgi:hypothetical protein
LDRKRVRKIDGQLDGAHLDGWTTG